MLGKFRDLDLAIDKLIHNQEDDKLIQNQEDEQLGENFESVCKTVEWTMSDFFSWAEEMASEKELTKKAEATQEMELAKKAEETELAKKAEPASEKELAKRVEWTMSDFFSWAEEMAR